MMWQSGRCASDSAAQEFSSSVWYRAPARARPCSWKKLSRCFVKAIASRRWSETSLRKTMPCGWRAAKLPSKITTGTLCHLEAVMVQHALEGWDLNHLDFLFIENVGNLICPSSYDLGESLRLVLISVTEGEDKPLKYPTIFNSADVAVVTKMDLASAVEFDWRAAHGNIQAVRPGMQVLRLSAKTGEGMDEYLAFLTARLEELRTAAAI